VFLPFRSHKTYEDSTLITLEAYIDYSEFNYYPPSCGVIERNDIQIIFAVHAHNKGLDLISKTLPLSRRKFWWRAFRCGHGY
jgi:hypothetical protein